MPHSVPTDIQQKVDSLPNPDDRDRMNVLLSSSQHVRTLVIALITKGLSPQQIAVFSGNVRPTDEPRRVAANIASAALGIHECISPLGYALQEVDVSEHEFVKAILQLLTIQQRNILLGYVHLY